MMPDVATESHPVDRERPWEELKTTGLLWLINASVLHPRGYALGLCRDAAGEVSGWCLLGDGTEPWLFTDDNLPEGAPTLDDLLRLTKELLP